MKLEDRILAEFSIMEYYALDYYQVQGLTDHALKIMIEIMLERNNNVK